MERKYHPRNISEFKKGDLIMRVERAKLVNREDGSYLNIPFIYKGLNEKEKIIVKAISDDLVYLKEGDLFDIPSLFDEKEEILAWHEGWDYVNPEDAPIKEREKPYIKRESSIKNTNLTAFLKNH